MRRRPVPIALAAGTVGAGLFVAAAASTPLPPPADRAVGAVTLLYVPGEPATLFWERDLGMDRSDLRSCEETGGAAAWFEVCRSLMGFSQAFSNVLLGDPGPRGDPEVLLRGTRRSVRVTFRPADVVRTTTARAALPAARIGYPASTDPARRAGGSPAGRGIACAFAAPLPDGWRLVKREWRLSRGPGDSGTGVDLDVLPHDRLAGLADARCLLVVSDGLVDVVKEARVPRSLLSESFPVSASPLRLSPRAAADFRAETFVGRARAGERYLCRAMWPPLEGRADPCASFRTAEGVFDARGLRALPGAPLPGDPPVFLQLEFRREGPGGTLARLEVPTVLVPTVETLPPDAETADAPVPVGERDSRAGPPPGAGGYERLPGAGASATNMARPRVRLERSFLAEHLECTDPDGAPLLSPVAWRARGATLPGWQNAYLPAFLLNPGVSYTCTSEGVDSEPFPYDDAPAAFRGPSEVRFPEGSPVLPFRVRVPPTGTGGIASPECLAPEGFRCEELARAGTSAGDRLYALSHEGDRGNQGDQGDRTPPAIVRLTFPSLSGTLERSFPVSSEMPANGESVAPAREIPLTFEGGAWSCEPGPPGRQRILSTRWFLGTDESAPRGVGSRYVQPVVEVPTSLTCIVEAADDEGGSIETAYGQTLLQPPGPTIASLTPAGAESLEEPAPLLAVLARVGSGVEIRGRHEGAPLHSVACRLAPLAPDAPTVPGPVAASLPTGAAAAGSGSTASAPRTTSGTPLDEETPLPCSLVGGEGGSGGEFAVRVLEGPATRDALRGRILGAPPGSDPFEPIAASLRVTLSTARAAFELVQPLTLVLPNGRPRARAFVHFVDAKGNTRCLVVADDPDGNHLSAALSPRFQGQSRTAFSTRERERAFASLEGLLPHGGRRPADSFGTVLAAQAVFEGPARAGCEATLSDGTSLVPARSVASTEDSARALLERTERASGASTRGKAGAPDAPDAPGPPGSRGSPGSPGSRREATRLSSSRPRSSASPAAGSATERAPVVLRAKYHFTEAGTRAVPLPGSPRDRRLLACSGDRATCGAFFHAGGELRAAVSTSLPGGEVLLVLSEGAGRTVYLAARVTNAIYVPDEGASVGDCAALLERHASTGLPSYLSLSTSARTSAGDSHVPPSRVVSAIAAGADDVLCETTLSWKGAPTGARASSLREALVARRGTGPRRALGNEARHAGPVPVPLPRSRSVSLPSLAAALEGAQDALAITPLATRWKLVDCRVETAAGRQACVADPATLLVRNLPARDSTLEATVEHAILGRTRRVRLRQSFRALPSPLATAFGAVTLRRDAKGVVCSVARAEGSGGPSEFRLVRGFREVGFARSAGATATFEPPGDAPEGDLACRVSWDGGAETALMPGGSVPLDTKTLCVAWEPGSDPRPFECVWPEAASGAGMDPGRPDAVDRDLLRRSLESVGLSPRAWVKWILWSDEASWRQSLLLPPSVVVPGDTGAVTTRSARVELPSAFSRDLCLVRNEAGVDPARDDPPTPGRVRNQRPCTLLAPAEGPRRSDSTVDVFSNPSFTGNALSAPPPFLADAAGFASAARRAVAALRRERLAGKECVFRCVDPGPRDLRPDPESRCRNIAPLLAPLFSAGAPAEGCSFTPGAPAQAPAPANASAPAVAAANPDRLAVTRGGVPGTLLEVHLRTRDDSPIDETIPLGLLWP